MCIESHTQELQSRETNEQFIYKINRWKISSILVSFVTFFSVPVFSRWKSTNKIILFNYFTSKTKCKIILHDHCSVWVKFTFWNNVKFRFGCLKWKNYLYMIEIQVVQCFCQFVTLDTTSEKVLWYEFLTSDFIHELFAEIEKLKKEKKNHNKALIDVFKWRLRRIFLEFVVLNYVEWNTKIFFFWI